MENHHFVAGKIYILFLWAMLNSYGSLPECNGSIKSKLHPNPPHLEINVGDRREIIIIGFEYYVKQPPKRLKT